jgi:hypothetical protein
LLRKGGDLHIGQDVSIGYSSHTDSVVRVYLQETLTFLLLTTEAAVADYDRPQDGTPACSSCCPAGLAEVM